MPRKIKAEQEGRFAKSRKHRTQWPSPVVWGSGPFAEQALERWIARRDCDGTCNGHCARLARVSRLRSMYGRRRR